MLIAIITTVLIIAVYLISRNLWITLVGGIAVLMIMRTLKPILDGLWAKWFPSAPMDAVREEYMDDPVPGRGMRALIVTQHLNYSEGQKKQALFASMEADAVRALREEKPLFALRYDEVAAKKLPVKVWASVCGDKDSGMRKCYRRWLREIGANNFQNWRENSELFMHDGTYTDSNGAENSCAVLFMFDPRLPKE